MRKYLLIYFGPEHRDCGGFRSFATFRDAWRFAYSHFRYATRYYDCEFQLERWDGKIWNLHWYLRDVYRSAHDDLL